MSKYVGVAVLLDPLIEIPFVKKGDATTGVWLLCLVVGDEDTCVSREDVSGVDVGIEKVDKEGVLLVETLGAGAVDGTIE